MQGQILRSGRGRDDTRGRILLLTVLLAIAAIIGGGTAAVAGATIFEDNFDVAFEGWITSGSPDWYSKAPKNGAYSIQLRKDEAIERLIPTVGYTDVTVSFSLGAKSLDRSDEVVRALWYDGSQWGVLHAIAGGGGEDDGQLHTFSLSLPAEASENADSRLRFEIVGSSAADYGYVDDVLVSGELPVRTLTVDGQGTGSIRVDGVGYDLPWSGDFSSGSAVTLEAVPASCWAFTGWAGDLGGSDNPVVVVLDADKAVTADFSQLEYTLTLDAVGTGSIKVDGAIVGLPWSGQYACGTDVTLEGVPGAGWAFGSWSGDVSSTTPSIVVTMDGPKTITATFSQESYTLSLAKVGSGSATVDGTLRSLPWSGSFLSGSVVILEAVPDSCYQFTGWSGDLSGAVNPSTIIMDGSKSVTANFAMIQYTLSLAKTGNGSVRVDGTPQSLPWSGSFNCGSVVNLEAVPDSGWDLAGWSGDVTWSGGLLTVTMDSSNNITANFSEQPILVLTKTGNGSAKVDGTLQALPWSGQFASDTEVTLEAIPDSGWKFDGWSGDATWGGVTLVITMDGPKNITATFGQESYTLSLAKVGTGSATVDGTLRSLPWSGSFLSGTSVTLEAVPDSGWKFDGWSGDATWPGSQLIVTMDGPKSITASFSQESYTLSLAKVGSGSVTVDGTLRSLPWSGTFLSGTSVTLEAAADTGWKFDGWSGDATGPGSQLIVTMDTPNSITATFSQESYTLSLAKVGSGSVTVDGTLRSLPWSGTFLSGTSVTLEAAADTGWKFDGWSGDATWPGSQLTVTMDTPKNIAATFSQESYTLSLVRIGSGSAMVDGTLRSLPWSGSFLSGTSVTLEAVADSGWEFDGWSGDETGPGSQLIVTMDTPKSITATFLNQESYSLSLAKVGSGSATVDGTLRSLPWSGSFLSGTSVTLEAVPDSGWEFDGWSGDATWSGSVLYVTMDDDKNLAANFKERDSFVLSLSKTGAGTITVNGTAVSAPWSGELPRGSDVTLEAVADEGWRFNRWSGDLAGSQNPTAITMNGDWDITAQFAEIDYDLSVTAVGAGAVTVNGDLHSLPWSGEFALGSDIAMEAVPDSGWEFESWSGDLSGESNPAVFVMDGDRSITATFVEPDQFQLTVKKSGSGSVKVDGVERCLPWSGPFANGAQVTVEAVVEAGEGFVEWSGDVTGSVNPITLTMDTDKSIKAEFACTAGPFSDVPCDHWAAEAIAAVHDAGLASGYSDGRYLPDLAVTRAAMAVFLARGLAGGPEGVPAGPEEPTFGDVPTDHWAFAEVEYVVSRSVANGYGDGSYQPTWQITRGQMSAFVARAVAEPTGDEGLAAFDVPEAPSFSDVPASMWCYVHVEYLADLGIVTGYSDGLYRPAAIVTRDQMAVYVARAFDLLD